MIKNIDSKINISAHVAEIVPLDPEILKRLEISGLKDNSISNSDGTIESELQDFKEFPLRQYAKCKLNFVLVTFSITYQIKGFNVYHLKNDPMKINVRFCFWIRTKLSFHVYKKLANW